VHRFWLSHALLLAGLHKNTASLFQFHVSRSGTFFGSTNDLKKTSKCAAPDAGNGAICFAEIAIP
jgi:hypothetical protein